MLWQWTVAILCVVQVLGSANEYFDEHLYIKPLDDGKVYTRFKFKTTLENAVPRPPHNLGQRDEPQHYVVFPLAFGQILRQYAVTELHLSLNAGKWNYDTWGYPNDTSVGSGAELWVWMGENDTHTFDARWIGVRNALAGLFCASLGELNERRTTSPTYAFRPDGDIPFGLPHRLAYASHPSEHVCTENLTPFIKLLPCKAYSGIAALLNPHRLFDADWHGISIHAWWDSKTGIQVELGVQAVFDPVRLNGRKDRNWSFSHLFGKNIPRRCVAARESKINIGPPSSSFTLSPLSPTMNDGVAEYDVNSIQGPLDIGLKYSDDEPSFIYRMYPNTNPAIITSLESNEQQKAATKESFIPLSVQRSLSGTSQSKGRMHATFKNMQNATQLITYLETPPWIISFYLHTLTIRVNDEKAPRNDILQSINYIPTESNKPTLFESILLLPPLSTVYMQIDFDKTFLRYTEHPPDAQRGWDLPSAVLIPRLSDQLPPRMYTGSLLIDMATPDFSMPYNVITMSGALISMLFGNVFNLLTREFVAIKLDK